MVSPMFSTCLIYFVCFFSCFVAGGQFLFLHLDQKWNSARSNTMNFLNVTGRQECNLVFNIDTYYSIFIMFSGSLKWFSVFMGVMYIYNLVIKIMMVSFFLFNKYIFYIFLFFFNANSILNRSGDSLYSGFCLNFIGKKI